MTDEPKRDALDEHIDEATPGTPYTRAWMSVRDRLRALEEAAATRYESLVIHSRRLSDLEAASVGRGKLVDVAAPPASGEAPPSRLCVVCARPEAGEVHARAGLTYSHDYRRTVDVLATTGEADLFTPAERARLDADDKVPREPGCRCHLEAGDSSCPVHGSEDDDDKIAVAPAQGMPTAVESHFGATARQAGAHLAPPVDSAWLTTADAILADRQIAYDGQLTAEKFAQLMAEHAPPSRAGQGERGSLDRLRVELTTIRNAFENEDVRFGLSRALQAIDQERKRAAVEPPASPSREADAELLAAGFAIAAEHAEVSTWDGWHTTEPRIDWDGARKALAEAIAKADSEGRS